MPAIRSKGLFSGAGSVLFLNENHSDICIIVEFAGGEVRFPAHSLLLFSMSNVLRIMMEANLEEKSTRQITIKDSSPVAIKQFLRFLYVGEVELSDWRDVLDLVHLSHKYEVFPLLTRCEEQLVSQVSLSNVCILHEISETYFLESLLGECQKLISDCAFIILKTQSFENMSSKSVEYFTSNRSLNVEDESFILDSLYSWSAAECCRKCRKLTPRNILEIMEPFLHGISFEHASEVQKSFFPPSVIEKYQRTSVGRVKFFVPSSLHKHVTSLKFVVELGSYSAKLSQTDPLLFLKFSIDDCAYLVGFRIVGMFRTNSSFGSSNPQLTLCKENSKSLFVHFNLNSIPWKCGHIVGEYMWKEMVAFFPQPTKIDTNTVYSMTLRYGNLLSTKWPRTRLENKEITTVLGKINFFTFGTCTGITELFLLPAPRDEQTFTRHQISCG